MWLHQVKESIATIGVVIGIFAVIFAIIVICRWMSDQSKQTLTGHSSVVETVAFSPDGKTLASGSWDNTVKLWAVEP